KSGRNGRVVVEDLLNRNNNALFQLRCSQSPTLFFPYRGTAASDQLARNIVPVAATVAALRPRRVQRFAVLIEQLARQNVMRSLYLRGAVSRGLIAKTPLHLLPCLSIQDGFVLPGMTNLLVADLTDVDRVREQFIKGAAREGVASRAPAVLRYANLRNNPAPIQIVFQKTDASQFEVPFIDLLNPLRFFFNDYQPAIADVIAEGTEASHPHTLFLGGSNLVADPFARHLALKLRERQQHVQCEAAHRGGGIELLSDRDERNVVSIEDLHHLGEVRQRAGQPVDLVHNHCVDPAFVDIGQKALQCRALHGAARNAAIIVLGLDQTPTLTRLALDKRFTGFALSLQRVEILLEALLGRFPGVHRAALNRRFSAFHETPPSSDLSNRKKEVPTTCSR